MAERRTVSLQERWVDGITTAAVSGSRTRGFSRSYKEYVGD